MRLADLLYYFIPAGSLLSPVKYLNPVGIMKTENIYGGYLNFNCFGYTLSRLSLSLGLIILLCVTGTAGSLLLFRSMKSFEVKKFRLSSIPFTPHTSLLRHESYKLLITNRALPVLIMFGLLLGYRSLGHSYSLSVGEQYYQSIMRELEGQLTPEKESVLLSERHKYEDALQNLDQIDQMVSAGELDNVTAEALKAPANMTLAFYPFFQRVESQYAHIQEDGGCCSWQFPRC